MKFRNWLSLPLLPLGLLAVAVGTTGCGGNTSTDSTPAPAGDFTLSLTPATVSVNQAASVTSTITVAPLNGFTGTVALSASGLPSGVTASFSPVSSGSSTLTLAASDSAALGAATVTVTGTSGSLNHTAPIALTITLKISGPAYAWPAYSPNLNYTYDIKRVDNPAGLTVRPDWAGITRTTLNNYFAFQEGPTRNSLLTDEMVTTELDRLHADWKIACETMGFAQDRGNDPANNNYTNYYLLGSGITEDSDAAHTSTWEGGYQAWVEYPAASGIWWPSEQTSYHAIYKAFNGDALNRSNLTHESIHVAESGTGSFQKAGWVQEGHNCYFGSWLIFERDGVRTLGYLDACSALGPHIPIEAAGGWLKDGTFGGPNFEGVTDTNKRNFFGANQYCCTFPLFLRLWVSDGINNWLWKNNKPNSETVLQTLARGLGDEQAQRVIVEYRAKVALLDFKEWSTALQTQVDGQWGNNNYAYADTTQSGSDLTPSADTLPGVSGANYIPLTVTTGTTASVTFNPIGANMRCQLCYKATDGTTVYGAPVSTGACNLDITKAAKNNVIIAVITNVDTTAKRTAKFNYTLTLGSTVTKAPTAGKYY